MRSLFLSGLMALLSLPSLFAQNASGGRGTYAFLNLNPSARVTALGGYASGMGEADVNLAFQNPSLLDSTLHMKAGLNWVKYLSDVGYGTLVYAHKLPKKYGTLSGGVQYINYGTFTRTDPAGYVVGTFSASESNVQLGWGKSISPSVAVGANLKWINSSFEAYSSMGLAGDLAVSWRDTAENLYVVGLIRNAGMQLTTYAGSRENLPLDVQLSFSKKLKHVPLRYGLTLHHLHRWDLAYYDPNDRYYTENVQLLGSNDPVKPEKPGWSDELFRHLVFHGEFLLGKALRFRVGYNHQRRAELSIPNRSGLSGFSWGFGLNFKRFKLDYGNGIYSLAGNTNAFSLTLSIADFR